MMSVKSIRDRTQMCHMLLFSSSSGNKCAFECVCSTAPLRLRNIAANLEALNFILPHAFLLCRLCQILSPLHSPPFLFHFLLTTEEYPLALGKAVSKKNREVLQTQLQNLVYGETEFTTLGNVFEKIKTVYGRPNQVSHSQLQI